MITDPAQEDSFAMHLVCPRCDSPFTAHDIQCHTCGYRWQTPCFNCGKPNIPAARFCGSCGIELSFKSRVWNDLRQWISRPFGFNIRNAATGFAFGGLLAFFAFGTMGMTSSKHMTIRPEEARAGAARSRQMKTVSPQDSLTGLRDWRTQAGAAADDASLRDLIQVGRKLLDTLSPVSRDDEGTEPFRDAERLRYLQGLRSGLATDETQPLKRGDVALFLYRMASDILDASPVSAPEPAYSDIPRHHYMTIPIRTLESLHISISRDKNVFGSDDTITISALGKIAADFLNKATQDHKGVETHSVSAKAVSGNPGK